MVVAKVKFPMDGERERKKNEELLSMLMMLVLL